MTLKKINAILFGLALAGTVTPQGAAAQAYQELDINSITAGAQASGALFTNPTTVAPAFEVMDGSGIHTFFGSELWFAGQDVNGQLKFAKTDYDLLESMSYGPIASDYSGHARFNRIWKVNRTQIDSFIDVFNGTITDPSYFVPAVILDWPAHGDTALGQSFYLAPFVDVDGDGVYNPASAGDYPEIKGDQALFWIMNDMHTPGVNNARIGLEVHCMLYGLDCTTGSAMDNTVFGTFKFINRGTQTLFDTHIGVWSDLDVGSPTDDRMQSDVERGSYFAYSPASGNYPSMAQSVTFLGGPLLDPNMLDDSLSFSISSSVHSVGYSDGIVDNERSGMASFLSLQQVGTGSPWQQTPTTFVDHYQYMQGKWLDGSDLFYGGTGHTSDPNTNINQPAKYMLPASSDPQGYGTGGNGMASWSEETEGWVSGDRRAVGSTETFTFGPGAEQTLDLAYVFASSTEVGTSDDAIATLKSNIDYVRNMYASCVCACELPTAIGNVAAKQDFTVEIYPNPASHQLHISIPSMNREVNVTVFDATGRILTNALINQSETDLSVVDYPAGIYLIEFRTGERRQLKQLVVQ